MAGASKMEPKVYDEERPKTVIAIDFTSNKPITVEVLLLSFDGMPMRKLCGLLSNPSLASQKDRLPSRLPW